MNKHIPYSTQDISEGDIKSVTNVLRSNFLTQGPLIPKFENKFSKKFLTKGAVAFNSATSALHISCVSLGLKKNDIVWTSPISFVASANCALYCGAKIDFVDINNETLNIDITILKNKLDIAKKRKKLPKILIVVHFAGNPVEMEKIYKLTKPLNIKIIEDASHALGAYTPKYKVGSCLFSDITIFSFHPVKMITTAEGGMALSNDKKIIKNLLLLRSHGISRDINAKKDGGWYYKQLDLGFNYRLNELQAALGINQMKRLNYFLKKRNLFAKKYDKLLKDLPLILPNKKLGHYSSYHLYVIRIDSKKTKKKRKEVFDFMRKANIGVNVHYIPIHLQPYYKKLGFRKGDFPIAEKYYEEAISIPLHSNLNDKQQGYIVKTLKKIF